MGQFKVGIVGGGQLAGMLAEELHRHDVACYSLDPDPESPAVSMGAIAVEGDRKNESDIARLGDMTEVVTVDLEDVSVEGLAKVEKAGTRCVPATESLVLLTDKLSQKKTMQAAGLPTAPFIACDGSAQFDYGQLGWPVVQKAAQGGYDGRGVQVLGDHSELDRRLQVPGYIEQFVPDAVELAVMVAREDSGRTTVWNTVEMAFDPATNMLDYLIAPARCDADVNAAAQDLAKQTIAAFNGTGVFGVELFLTPEGNLLINEIAPRTHNSGHYTMDACITSQFKAQYQILTGQPVSDPTQARPAVMFNVLGDPGYEGDTVVEGFDILSATSDVYPHLYGKRQCFPFRKMGHVTVVADDLEQAQQLAAEMRSEIVVRGANKID